MLINCTHCNKEFDKKPSRIAETNYCSRECRHTATTTGVHTTCYTCNKEIFVANSKVTRSKSGFNFCSRSCATSYTNTLKVGDKHPSFISGNSSIYYRKLAFSVHPHQCNRCSYSEHQQVLQVHHIDHNRSNNDISNLEILCPTCHQVEHIVIHGGTQNKPE